MDAAADERRLIERHGVSFSEHFSGLLSNLRNLHAAGGGGCAANTPVFLAYWQTCATCVTFFGKVRQN
jgi:hypothetical protein